MLQMTSRMYFKCNEVHKSTNKKNKLNQYIWNIQKKFLPSLTWMHEYGGWEIDAYLQINFLCNFVLLRQYVILRKILSQCFFKYLALYKKKQYL